MSRKKDNTKTPAEMQTPAADFLTPQEEAATKAAAQQEPREITPQIAAFAPEPTMKTADESKSQPMAEKHAETDKKENAPAPFSLSFKNVSALEFNFFKPDANELGVQHILRFAGLLGTEKQKHHIGANLIFEVRKLDEDQQPAYLFEICEVTQAGVIRTARHFAINQYWSLAQFFTQEISDNADTIAANLYAVSLIEIRAGAAKGGKDLPIFRVEKAEGFTFTL